MKKKKTTSSVSLEVNRPIHERMKILAAIHGASFKEMYVRAASELVERHEAALKAFDSLKEMEPTQE